MKHAYLILAHNEFGLLQTLVSCLDDPRNDIFIHIDKKVKEMPKLKAAKAGMTILDNRIDIFNFGRIVVDGNRQMKLKFIKCISSIRY